MSRTNCWRSSWSTARMEICWTTSRRRISNSLHRRYYASSSRLFKPSSWWTWKASSIATSNHKTSSSPKAWLSRWLTLVAHAVSTRRKLARSTISHLIRGHPSMHRPSSSRMRSIPSSVMCGLLGVCSTSSIAEPIPSWTHEPAVPTTPSLSSRN